MQQRREFAAKVRGSDAHDSGYRRRDAGG
jgi:hypothetical protein